jgi:hypothetical protein
MESATARLLDLHPTQFALGLVQVKVKMAKTREVPAGARDAFLARTPIVVVRGPAGHFHVIDHHHWTRAWIDLGIEQAPVHIKADFGKLDRPAFLSALDGHGWIHPYDERGRKVGIDRLPRSVADMPDDPYQSLAAFLRAAGVFENPGEFNAKFAWADYLRKYVTGNSTTIEGFAEMLAMAFHIANTEEASALPGYRADNMSSAKVPPPSGRITI